MASPLRLLFVTPSEELANTIVSQAAACGLAPAYTIVDGPVQLSRAMADESWDVVLTEPDVPGMSWQDVMQTARSINDKIPFAIILPEPDSTLAMQAMREGVDDILLCDDWRIGSSLQRLQQQADQRRQQAIALRALNKEEKDWRRLVENTMLGIFRCRPWGELISVNPAFAEIFGYQTPDEVLAAQGHGTLHHIDEDDFKAMWQTIVTTGTITDYEVRAVRADGSAIWLSVSAKAVRGKAGEISGIEGTVEDIDKRKTVESMIIRAKQEWEKTFDSVPDIIVLIDNKLRIHRCNMALGKLLGHHPKDLVGMDSRTVLSLGSGNETIFDNLPDMKRGESHTEELYLPIFGGYYLITFSPFFSGTDEHAKPEGTVLVAHDISGRKQLEAQLRQSQKMEAIGTLAGGIAHDFNNILGVMMGYTEMSLASAPEDSPISRRLDAVLEAGKRARDLIHQILTFSRHEEPTRHPLSLASPVKETVKLLRASLPSNIEISLNTLDAPSIQANLSQIQQVVMNLCANAAHAMRESGGKLSLTLDTIMLDSTNARNQSVPEGKYVRLRVQDSGHGIDPEIIHNIFNPFFTTKKPDEGSGMGLALVHGIVTAHGGNIEVDSVPGEGTLFTILLPAISQQQISGKEVPAPSHAGSGSVLVVDDEEALAVIMGEMLESMGYTPAIVHSPSEALRLIKENPQDFTLVLTDQTMPGMTGTELAQKIHAIRNDLPVVLCTGFSEGLTREGAREKGISELLLKPVLRSDLAKALSCLGFDCGL
ncbi:PAS domain S-box protein [Oleidesulfovibrio sp.]|uniref:hybrid sensor histidine kinase/response regulator n=1 Tax=Oleidesulfovibrio sp. TaxID=2909707 RepID=UPI003A8680BD